MTEALDLFFRLLLAHLITDFLLQSRLMVEHKQEKGIRSVWLWGHALLSGILAWALVMQWTLWPVFAITFVTHLLIDSLKIKLEASKGWNLFIPDQTAHLGVIMGLTVWISSPGIFQFEYQFLPMENVALFLCGVIFVLKPSSILIQQFFERWHSRYPKEWEALFKSSEENTELPRAGAYIGYFERILIYLFVLLGQFAAIGLLIAAKSILRFENLRNSNPRIQSEYVLLGTLISVTLALIAALTVRVFWI